MPGPVATLPGAGRLLVATPALVDPNFVQTVILLLDHDEDGTLGVVINRPTEVRVDAVLPDWQPYAAEPGVLFQGGPVSLDSAIAVATARRPLADGAGDQVGFRPVAAQLGLVDLDIAPEDLVGELTGLRIFAGYAGWGPGQLDAELAEGSWYVVPAQPGDTSSDQPADLWRRVLRRQPDETAFASTYIDDPSLN